MMRIERHPVDRPVGIGAETIAVREGRGIRLAVGDKRGGRGGIEFGAIGRLYRIEITLVGLGFGYLPPAAHLREVPDAVRIERITRLLVGEMFELESVTGVA